MVVVQSSSRVTIFVRCAMVVVLRVVVQSSFGVTNFVPIIVLPLTMGQCDQERHQAQSRQSHGLKGLFFSVNSKEVMNLLGLTF